MDKIYALFEDRGFLSTLYAFAYARTNNTQDAEDLAGEIILRVLKSRQKNSDIQYPMGFIWTVAKRAYADYCEKRSKYNSNVIPGNYSDAALNIADCSYNDDLSEDEERVRAILREIAFLSKTYREVCVLYYLDDKSVAEIAKTLNIKAATCSRI